MQAHTKRYRTIRLLGSGAYAAVYEALDTKTNLRVAIKQQRACSSRHDEQETESSCQVVCHFAGCSVLQRNGSANGLSLYQGIPTEVLREVAIVRGLKHPNLVKLLDVEFGPGRAAMAMVLELCHCNLRDLMADLNRAGACWMETRSMKILLRGILSGIAYCHQRSIIHRDLKPDNILLDETRCIAKIADFGMSRQLHRLDESTYTGGLVTRWYRSPEIMLGDKNYGPAVDMWSIGCILVEMISLCPAFACNTEIECLMVIFKRFGTPDELTYPGIAALPNYTVHFPQWRKPDSLFDALHVLVSSPYYGDSKVLDLVCGLMSLDPRQRISAQACIDAHPYLEHDLF